MFSGCSIQTVDARAHFYIRHSSQPCTRTVGIWALSLSEAVPFV
jgi:hypothetical protein